MSPSSAGSFTGSILIAGAGKMGVALLAGLFGQGLDATRVHVQDPSPTPETVAFLASHGLTASASAATLSAPASVLLIAVKPQLMDAVLPGLKRHCGPDTLTLSIAAGRSLASLARHLPAGAAIVRAMPNTPAAIGRGMTVLVANAFASANQRAVAEGLMAAVGKTAWIEDEALMDAVTAVSGSGPAYVFFLAECLAQAGVKAGLPPELSATLARATVVGSGELLGRSDLTAATLRANVTSPGGTTAAALEVLGGEAGLAKLMAEAVIAAAQRSRDLAG